MLSQLAAQIGSRAHSGGRAQRAADDRSQHRLGQTHHEQRKQLSRRMPAQCLHSIGQTNAHAQVQPRVAQTQTESQAASDLSAQNGFIELFGRRSTLGSSSQRV